MQVAIFENAENMVEEGYIVPYSDSVLSFQKFVLTLSHTSPGFYVYAEQVF